MSPKKNARKTAASDATPPGQINDPTLLTRRHLCFGWWTLLIFLSLGLALEILHGFKVSYYLKVSNETRRLMWTLAHAHGTLLGLVNLGFAFTARLLPAWSARERGTASVCLRGATLLMPAGFFLGGLIVYSGDPGLGIILVPIGGLLLMVAVFLTARGAGRLRVPTDGPTPGGATTFKDRQD
jgi:hypothetical protein